MAKKRIFQDRILTSTEKSRRHSDAIASIDEEMNEAFQRIDAKRKEKGTKSFLDFVNTYCVGVMLDEPPSQKMCEAIKQMEFALEDARPYQIMLPRGSGKTSIAECFVLYVTATGRRKFCVVVSQNARSAGNILNDCWRLVSEPDTAFSQDFPEVCSPFQLTNGSYRRRQQYRGIATEIAKNAANIHFARLEDSDGNELPSSRAVITARGLSSGIRGLKVGKQRPDIVLLDDLQDASSALSPEQVEKTLNIIKKDIMNLSSKGKLAILMTATPLCAEDLTDKICNDPQWKTTKYKAILKFPRDMEEHPDDGLWKKYFQIYDDELANDERHEGSLKFYTENRNEMDEGSELFSPNRFKVEDGHISGLQAILEKRHLIGESAFQAEMQMTPAKLSFSIDITPSKVVQKVNRFKEFEIPDGYTYVAGAIDLNVSHAITYSVLAFKPDNTAVVVHYGTYRCNVDQKLTDTQYNSTVYGHLTKVCQRLKNLGMRIDGIAIDAGGRNWNVVCDFCKNSVHLVGLTCCAFSGRSSNMFNPYVRSRLRDAIGKTVLCGDAREQVRSGAGNKYVFFDADVFKEMAQKALLNEVGSAGSLSLYSDSQQNHSDFAIQVCNERLRFVQHRPDGRDLYTWTTKEPHDYLDTLSMAYAVACQAGIGAQNFQRQSKTHTGFGFRKKKRIVIV